MTSVRRIRIRRAEVRVWRRSRCVEAVGFILEYLPRAVFRAVVNDDDFVRNTAQVQFEMEMLDGGRDAAFLVARGNDYRQESEWRVTGHG